MRAFLVETIDLAGRNVVAHEVAPVFREPELAVRVPIEADGVANATRDDAESFRLQVEARDRSVGIGPLADVAGRADRNVEPSVGTEADELPTVVAVRGVLVGQDARTKLRPLELSFDILEDADAADLGDVEIPVLHRDAVGLLESLRDDAHEALLRVRVDRVDPVVAGAHEEPSPGREGQRAGAVHFFRENFDAEARRSFGRRNGRAGRKRDEGECEQRVSHPAQTTDKLAIAHMDFSSRQ